MERDNRATPKRPVVCGLQCALILAVTPLRGVAGAGMESPVSAAPQAPRPAILLPPFTATSTPWRRIIFPLYTDTPTPAQRVIRPTATATTTALRTATATLAITVIPTYTATPTVARLVFHQVPTMTASPTRATATKTALPAAATPSRTPTATRTPFSHAWLTPRARLTIPGTLGLGLLLVPSAAAVDQTVTFFAKGYTAQNIVHTYLGNVTQPGESVDLRFAGVPGPCGSQNVVFAHVTPDTHGWIQGTFVVPDIACYTVTASTFRRPKNAGASLVVQAVGSKSGHVAAGALSVPKTTLASVATSPDGTVRVRDAGYAAGEYVFLQYRYGTDRKTTALADAGVGHADQAGSLLPKIPKGYGLPGGYQIVGDGVKSGFTASAAAH